MDENLISITQTMSSLQIAELTGKQHAHIMRDIRTLLGQGVTESNFGLSEYKDKTGRSLPCFNLTKKGCLILASGYDAKLRERIIDRWEELETEKQKGGFAIPQSFSEALQLAANQAKQIEQLGQSNQMLLGENEHLTAENRQLAPKAAYTDDVLQSTSTYTLTQIAHDLGLRSVHTLTRMLSDKKVIYYQSGQWQPTAKVAGKGYFSTRTAKYFKSDGTIGTTMTTVVTETGRQYLHNLTSRA